MGYGASRAFPFPQVPVPVPGLGRAHHHHTHTHTTGHGGASSALASDRLNAQRPAPNGGPLEEEMYRFRSGALNKGPQKTPGRPPYEGAALLLHISRSWGWTGGGLHEVPAPWLYSKPQDLVPNSMAIRAVQRTLPVFWPGGASPPGRGPRGGASQCFRGRPPPPHTWLKTGLRSCDEAPVCQGELKASRRAVRMGRSALAKGNAVGGGRLGVVWSPPALAASTEVT
jgi:hypothetical protein